MGIYIQDEEEFNESVLSQVKEVNVEEESKTEEGETTTEKYKLSKEKFMALFKEQVDKIDPVDGICADIEDKCEVGEDGLIETSALVAFMESVNWLDASKQAIMHIIDLETNEAGKINYKAALHKIVQDWANFWLI